jgi:hypothetical protein
MLIAFAPANKMEAFFREGMKRHDNAYSSSANARMGECAEEHHARPLFILDKNRMR